MQKKFKLGKDALVLSILTLVTVLVWIGFDVYRALTRSEIPKVLRRQIAPLNPKVDWETIEGLKMRQNVSQEELERVVIPEISPSPLPSPKITPSPAATPGAGEEATESGSETI